MHELLGHLGWKTIKRGLAQVQGCEGLVKLLDGVGDNRSSEEWGQGAKYQDAVQKEVRNRGLEGDIGCRRYRRDTRHRLVVSSFSPTVAI
jgi:hypothetical protein